MTPATWISLAALALALAVAVRQEVLRIRARPKLLVSTNRLSLWGADDSGYMQSIIIVRVRATGGKMGLEKVDFEWLDRKPPESWGFDSMQPALPGQAMPDISDYLGMKVGLNEMEPKVWQLRITSPYGNPRGVHEARRLRAVAHATSGKKYYSEPFDLSPDVPTHKDVPA